MTSVQTAQPGSAGRTAPEHALGGEQREAVAQVEAQLRPKHGERAGAGAVLAARAGRHHVGHQRQVLCGWAGRVSGRDLPLASAVICAPAWGVLEAGKGKW